MLLIGLDSQIHMFVGGSVPSNVGVSRHAATLRSKVGTMNTPENDHLPLSDISAARNPRISPKQITMP